MKTIAYMTGLGVTTVSKALKDAPDIGATTKARVKAIADQIGYRPHRAGLGLRTGKTDVLSLVLKTGGEVDTLTSELLEGIGQAIKNTPYNLTLTPYASDDDPLEPVRNIVETGVADGIILSSIESNDSRLAYLHSAGFPFATHGRSDMGINHAYVDFNNELFGLNAVNLLADLGCQKVGIILPSPRFTYAQFMQNGYQKALRDRAIEGFSLPLVTLEDSIDQVADNVARVMLEKGRPDSFICGSMRTTFGIVGGIEKAGLKVGSDINIVAKQSPGNILKWLGRQIYSIEEDFSAAGFGLASSLMAIIEGSPVDDYQTLTFPESWGRCVLADR